MTTILSYYTRDQLKTLLEWIQALMKETPLEVYMTETHTGLVLSVLISTAMFPADLITFKEQFYNVVSQFERDTRIPIHTIQVLDRRYDFLFQMVSLGET